MNNIIGAVTLALSFLFASVVYNFLTTEGLEIRLASAESTLEDQERRITRLERMLNTYGEISDAK